MYTKWLVAVLASIVGLALVNGQSNDTNVTSVAPNADSSTVNTTTVAPTTTTTTTSPTTTPHSSTLAPTVPPTPSPEPWNGTVKDQNGTCISVKFTIVIHITYNTTNNSSSPQSTAFIIPTNAFLDESNSYCSVDNEPEGLGIYFVNEQHTSANLTLIFNRTKEDVWVQSIKLSFNLTRDLFPEFKDATLYDTIVSFENKDLSLFKVASAHSYVCGAAQSADLGGDQKDIHDVTIDFTESQVEAYIDPSKEGKFDSEIDCKSEISDVVPIAVGAALAGLVIIVLIAYFIGRRRSRRLAYQSV